MTKVKICGITNSEDAIIAQEAGVDFLGFIFAKSPRQISIDSAKEILSELSSDVKTVGVFVDEDKDTLGKIVQQLPRLDYLQLHGNESTDYCDLFKQRGIIKAFRIKDNNSIDEIAAYKDRVNMVLLDTFSKESYGGTGKVFDWDIAKDAAKYEIPIILSGGLNPDNVEDAVKVAQPYMVDVSSGVESSPGKKDQVLVRQFIETVKNIS
ncbi:MAG: phosphoribosylanthranilate isomerase [Candidatus Omnitrophota bacterium]